MVYPSCVLLTFGWNCAFLTCFTLGTVCCDLGPLFFATKYAIFVAFSDASILFIEDAITT